MLRNLLLSLAAMVLLAAMVATSTTPPTAGFGEYISAALSAERVQVAISDVDDPTMEEKQQLVVGAAAIGSLYYCDKAGIYAPKMDGAELYQVAWARIVSIFAGYEKFEGSPMYMGAMYISQLTNETAMNGIHMKVVDDSYEPVTLDSPEVCMQAEAALRTVMQPGKVLDGKWRAGQRGA